MGLRFEDIFDSNNTITPIVQEKVNGVPEILSPFTTTTTPHGEKAGTYARLTGTSGMAPVTGYDSASGLDELSGTDVIPWTALNVRRHFVVDSTSIRRLKGTDPIAQQVEAARIRNSISRITSRVRGTLLGSIYSMLNGQIIYDTDGNMLDPATDTDVVTNAVSHDCGIPSGHKDQLAVFGTDIASTTWSDNTNSTPVIDIMDIQEASMKETGLMLDTCLYGPNVYKDLRDHDDYTTMIAGRPDYVQSFMSGAIPSGFGGIQNWVPINLAFAEAHTSTDTTRSFIDFFPDDIAIFLPMRQIAEWYTLYQVAVDYPTQLGVSSDAMAAIGSAATAFGPYGYATVGDDPLSVRMVIGHSWFPALLNPKAVFVLDSEWT